MIYQQDLDLIIQRTLELSGHNQLIPLKEAAKRLNASVITLRRWIKSGKITAYKPGRKIQVRTVDVNKLLSDSCI